MNFEQKERIDFVIRRFQEIIEKYDEIQKMIVVFTQQIDEIKATKPKDEENFKRLEQNLSSLSDKHEQKSALCRQDFDRHENNISSLSEVQKKNEFTFSKINESINSLESSLSICKDLSQKAAKTIDFQDLSKKMNDLKDIVIAQNKDFVSLSQKVYSSLPEMNSKLNEISSFKASLELLGKDILKNINSVSWLSNERQKDLSTFSSKLEETIKTLEMKMDEKISSIPAPIIPSIEDNKNALKSHLEPVFLDAKNANLRSTNNESKISLIEKKIEQLQLLINKLQLG
jgi:chromosome segregation ATPase